MENKAEKITMHQVLWYFTLFSIIGLLIETTFGFATTGILESRKGLLWGPFCPVYGVGAVIIILALNQFRNHPIKLLIYGSILGNIVEYLLSYGLEAIYGIRFWDYAFISLNLNGRICLKYSFFWGILSLLLIQVIKPWIDKILKKVFPKPIKLLDGLLFLFFTIDTLVTVWAVMTYQERVQRKYQEMGTKQDNNWVIKIEETFFPIEMMKKTFPNLRYIDEEGKQYFMKDIL